jgi:hypothetical protein
VIDAARSAFLLMSVTGSLLLAACSGQNAEPGIGASSAAAPTEPTETSSGSTARQTGGAVTKPSVRRLPWTGEVVVSRTLGQGIVIRDSATGGRRFFLADESAGECLNFLDANPKPSHEAFDAACPGKTR